MIWVLSSSCSAFLQIKVRIAILSLTCWQMTKHPGLNLDRPTWFLAIGAAGFIFASLASVMVGWAQSWTPEWRSACAPSLPAEALALLSLAGPNGISGFSPSHNMSEAVR